MKNEKLPSAERKGDNGRPDVTDFISRMPDDVLVMILSRMPVKGAVVTSRLSTRWRFLWCNLIKLNFDGTETLDKMANDETICDLQRAKYINQVNGVINSYNNNPRVQVFQIRFDLDESHSHHIDKWIRFALDKKVEKFDMDLLDKSYNIRDPAEKYDLMLPSSAVGQMLSLKKLFLRCVNLNESTLNEVLKNSPHLETIDMFGLDLFPRVCVSGEGINLKHFKMVCCYGIESISLHGLDLVSFQYHGPEVTFHLTDLPKLSKLDIGEVSVGFVNNVFSQISSCALYLEVLNLDMWTPQKYLNVNAIIKLPNVKKLMLGMGAIEDDSLLGFTSIAQACPRLESFSISLRWHSPMKRRRKVRHVAAPQLHQNLKLLEIMGYFGRISDLELAVYAIENSVALKKIIIDPCCDAYGEDLTKEECLKRHPAARSSAKRQITPILPPGADLVIL